MRGGRVRLQKFRDKKGIFQTQLTGMLLTSSPSGLSMVIFVPSNGRPLDMNLILSEVVSVVGPV